MSKFKNRLASIVLSTITLAGGVTTCLISNSAVYQCKAIITDGEMKELINEALRVSFRQNDLLPKITADNLKEVLQKALDTITRGKHDEPLTEETRTEVQTQVNTFLFELSKRLVKHLRSHPGKPELQYETPIMIDELAQNLRKTPPGLLYRVGTQANSPG